MKKIYLVSGLAITGVLAYFMFFRKMNNVLEQQSVVDDSVASTPKDNVLDSSSVVKDTTKEEAQFFLDQYEEINKIYKKEIDKTRNNPLMNRDIRNRVAFENFVKTGQVPTGFGRVIFYKKLVSLKNDLDEVEQKINNLGYKKVGDTFVKSSNILTS